MQNIPRDIIIVDILGNLRKLRGVDEYFTQGLYLDEITTANEAIKFQLHVEKQIRVYWGLRRTHKSFGNINLIEDLFQAIQNYLFTRSK